MVSALAFLLVGWGGLICIAMALLLGGAAAGRIGRVAGVEGGCVQVGDRQRGVAHDPATRRYCVGYQGASGFV